MDRKIIMKEIDHIMTQYCEGCFLRAYFRKEYSHTYAHQFCINQCTVGANLQVKGEELLKK